MTSRAEIIRQIDDGTVDTVILAIPDQQGRLVGKRFTGRHFRDYVAGHGMHACNYLLTVDVEMEPLPGYQLANWEAGYGDFSVAPDWSTARLVNWLPGTALLLGDVHLDDGTIVEVAPRQILRRQIERARAMGFAPMVASELEAYIFRDSFRAAHAKGYKNLDAFAYYLEDYVLLQGSREEPLLRTIRNEMEDAGIPVEGTKGEWGKGQIEFNLQYTNALTMADRHVIFKHGAKEIADSQHVAITFMAKPDAAAAGSSCHIHVSLWDVDGRRNLFWAPENGGQASKTFEHFLAGQLALMRDFSLCLAPNVNSYKRFQSHSWAPTAIAWARDNRTTGLRVVGHGNSLRIENRIPGADVNPYLAYAAILAAGLHGIANELPLPPATQGDIYTAANVTTVPTTIREAIGAWEASAAVPQLLSEAVHAHYGLTAKHEAAAFERAVTDWELNRYFERI